jgi:type I restriction enzyme S subunit
MSRLVPKLRFKEFSGEWEDNRLGNVYKFFPTKSFPRDKLNYEKGKVKNIHYGDIHTKFSTLFDITKETVPYINQSVNISNIKKNSYCLEGDIVFADASEDLDDIGKSIELINLNNESLLAGLHTLLARQIEKNIIKGFTGYLFKSNSIRNQIKREAQGAKVLGLSVRKLENISISFPKEKKEQQKIASCLSADTFLFCASMRESRDERQEAIFCCSWKVGEGL